MMLEINKIYLGDCLEKMNKIDDKSINLILTDIPYSEVNRKSNGLRNLDKGAADILTFDLNVFLEECNRICKDSIYIFCGWSQLAIIKNYFIECKLTTRVMIWEKTNPSPMNGKYIWLSGIEPAIYAKNKNATFNEHCKNIVLRFSNGSSKLHPTGKNLKLFEYLIKVSSNENDVVFDPCCGSGTTCLAALQNKRNFIGIEKNIEYYQIACNRIGQSI